MRVGGRLHNVGEERRLDRQEIACGRCWCEMGTDASKEPARMRVRARPRVYVEGRNLAKEYKLAKYQPGTTEVIDRDNAIHCGAGGPQRNYGSRMCCSDNIDNGT
jgi:hypothetical protein